MELLEEEEEEEQLLLAIVIESMNTYDYFQAQEIVNYSQQSLSHAVGVRDVLATLQATPSMLKTRARLAPHRKPKQVSCFMKLATSGGIKNKIDQRITTSQMS
jgi:hypothetical protein